MRHPLRVSHALVIASLLGCAAACTILTDLDGYAEPKPQPGVQGTDGGGDAASSTQPDGSVATSPDGSTSDQDGSIVLDPDAGEPCSDPTALIGRSDLTGLVSDGIPHFAFDGYSYVAQLDGVARCIWAWVDVLPTSGAIRVGVYSATPAGDDAQNFLRGVVIENAVANAWNKAAFPEPLQITKGMQLWIAVTSKQPNVGEELEGIGILYRETGCSPPYGRAADIGNEFPLVYDTYDVFNGACDAALYLGR